MSLERNELREELAAIIAASRELPPEHDRALADIFLDHAGIRTPQPPPAPAVLPLWQDWRVLTGAVLLALTTFLFGATMAHSADRHHSFYDGGYTYTMRGDGENDGGLGQGPGGNDNWPPFQQAPQQQSPTGPSL